MTTPTDNATTMAQAAGAGAAADPQSRRENTTQISSHDQQSAGEPIANPEPASENTLQSSSPSPNEQLAKGPSATPRSGRENVTQPNPHEQQLEVLQNILKELQAKEKDPPGLVWIESFLPSVIALATFGGQITFTVIPTITNSPEHWFGKTAVRYFLALAWLCFALALGVGSFAQLVLVFHKPVVKAGFEPDFLLKWAREMEKRKKSNTWWFQRIPDWFPTLAKEGSDEKVTWWEKGVLFMFAVFPMSLVLQVLVLLAFLFLSFVVMAYAWIVGVIAVASTGIFVIGLVVMWCIHMYLGVKEIKAALAKDREANPESRTGSVQRA